MLHPPWKSSPLFALPDEVNTPISPIATLPALVRVCCYSVPIRDCSKRSGGKGSAMKRKDVMQSRHATVIQAALVLGAVAAAGAAFSVDRSASPAPGPQPQPIPTLAGTS